MSIPANKGVNLTAFNLIAGGIANHESPLTPGSVFIKLQREMLGIGPQETFYVYITSVDADGVESDPEVLNLHALPYGDDHYTDEAGMPVNLQYKSFEFEIGPTNGWDVERLLDAVTLLGRPGKLVRCKISGTGVVQIKFNSFNSDEVTLTSNDEQFVLERGEIFFKRIWFNKPDEGIAKVRLFIAG
jgi:hypothetical protein